MVQTLWTTALTTACADHSDQHVGFLEHVVARVSISHPRRGDLQPKRGHHWSLWPLNSIWS